MLKNIITAISIFAGQARVRYTALLCMRSNLVIRASALRCHINASATPTMTKTVNKSENNVIAVSTADMV